MTYKITQGKKKYKVKGFFNRLMNAFTEEPSYEREHYYQIDIDSKAYYHGGTTSPNRICGVSVGRDASNNSVSVGWLPSTLGDMPCFEIFLISFSNGVRIITPVTKIKFSQAFSVDMFFDEKSDYEGHKKSQHDWAVNVYFKVYEDNRLEFNTHRAVMFRGSKPFEGSDSITITQPIINLEPLIFDSRGARTEHELEIERL